MNNHAQRKPKLATVPQASHAKLDKIVHNKLNKLVHLYTQNKQASMPPMSVYRILEFLEQQQLIHRLGSQNKFIACSHIHENCHHQVSQFLICRDCHSVKEISIEQGLIKALNQQVKDGGYQLLSPQLELDCICNQCLNNQ